MNREITKTFRKVYLGVEMLASVVFTIVWVMYELKHQFYGQSLTYWMCACVIIMTAMALMIPELVNQKTRELNKQIRKTLNTTAKHIPMSVVLSSLWSIQLSSDFETVVATVSMSSVIKFMIYGIIAGPFILELLMRLSQRILEEDLKSETKSVRVARY